MDHARVDTEESQAADKRIGRDLERQRGERLVVAGLRVASVSFSSTPLIDGTSIGEGMYSTTASSMACTPLFLNAEPHITGTISLASVRRGYPADLLDAQRLTLEELLQQLLVALGRGFDQLLTPLLAFRTMSAGMSSSS